MAIEIRQLTVKSDVVEDACGNPNRHDRADAADLSVIKDLSLIKEELMEDCREWLLDRQVDRRER